MKLATLRDGSRDGQLIVVSRDLATAHLASGIAGRLQQLLGRLELHRAAAGATCTRRCPRACPPRVPLRSPPVHGSAAARLSVGGRLGLMSTTSSWCGKARGAEMPESFWTDPLMYQAAPDDLLGPCDDIVCADEDFGIDFEAEVTVVTDDVPMGTAAEQAGSHIRLLMLAKRRLAAQPDPGRAGQGFRLLPEASRRTAFSRWRSRPTSWAMPGTTPGEPAAGGALERPRRSAPPRPASTWCSTSRN